MQSKIIVIYLIAYNNILIAVCQIKNLLIVMTNMKFLRGYYENQVIQNPL